MNSACMKRCDMATADTYIGVLLPMAYSSTGKTVGGLDELLACYTEEAVQQVCHEVTFKRLEWLAAEEEVPDAAPAQPFNDNLENLMLLNDPSKLQVGDWGGWGWAGQRLGMLGGAQ